MMTAKNTNDTGLSWMKWFSWNFLFMDQWQS